MLEGFRTKLDRVMGVCSIVAFIFALTWRPVIGVAGIGSLLGYLILERRMSKYKRLQSCGIVLAFAGFIAVLFLLLPNATLMQSKFLINETTKLRDTYTTERLESLPATIQSSYESLERSWNTEYEENARHTFYSNCTSIISSESLIFKHALLRVAFCVLIGFGGVGIAIVGSVQFERSRLSLC